MNEAHEQSTGADPEHGAEVRRIICPYCGHRSAQSHACDRCKGLFEPLSRQASQNAMGPWFIRDEANPFMPGCNYATLKMLIARGRVKPDTILRGPSTRQFWAAARTVTGVANLLGECHVCHQPVKPDSKECRHCGVVFEANEDRQFLGLSPIRLLPGQGTPQEVAKQTYVDRAMADWEARAEGSYQVSTTPAVIPAEEQPARPVGEESYYRPPEQRGDPDLTGSLLAERRRATQASTRMAVIGVLVGIVLLGVLFLILAALPDGSAKPAAATAPAAAPAPAGTAPVPAGTSPPGAGTAPTGSPR